VLQRQRKQWLLLLLLPLLQAHSGRCGVARVKPAATRAAAARAMPCAPTLLASAAR
jgi:hypothetical protein